MSIEVCIETQTIDLKNMKSFSRYFQSHDWSIVRDNDIDSENVIYARLECQKCQSELVLFASDGWKARMK
jgi:hypothetical protein